MSQAWLCVAGSPLVGRALSHLYDNFTGLEWEEFVCGEGGVSWAKLWCERIRQRMFRWGCVVGQGVGGWDPGQGSVADSAAALLRGQPLHQWFLWPSSHFLPTDSLQLDHLWSPGGPALLLLRLPRRAGFRKRWLQDILLS